MRQISCAIMEVSRVRVLELVRHAIIKSISPLFIPPPSCPGDNANIDPLLLPVSSIPRPTRESHPKIHFWSCSDYTIWKDSSAESHAGVRGKFNYLEDENGHNISSEMEMVTEIRRSMRNAWAELVNRKPSSPSLVSTSHPGLLSPFLPSGLHVLFSALFSIRFRAVFAPISNAFSRAKRYLPNN
ncbi:hypothetical protein BS17DRAFT_881134 [Gyrodon lividus]|nr:hypothetical protein BS17DRAFT_881134 [Gyrodon lividus]